MSIRVIAGQTDLGTKGAVNNGYIDPTYMDISLPANTLFRQVLPETHNAFVYVIDGSISLLEGDINSETENLVQQNELGVLSKGEQLSVESGSKGARFLLLAGQPLNEPVARGGPFVMNTKAEVLQAFRDFGGGNF